MTAATLLAELAQRDVAVEVQGDRLRLRAPRGALTPDLRAALAECKDELLSILGPPSAATVGAPEDDRRNAPEFPNRAGAPETGSPTEGPESKVTTTELAAYFTDLLAAHPGARPVKDRLALADYLARGVIHRYGVPEQVHWHSQRPLRQRRREEAFWVARCPAGHLTNEAIENHQVVGWACERCRLIYDARECRLVPRMQSAIGGESPA